MRYYLMIENKILNNKKLIEEILEAAENSGEAMTFAAFGKWLDRPGSQAEAIGVEAVTPIPPPRNLIGSL